MSFTDLRNEPPLETLIGDDFVIRGLIHIFAGPGESGKSAIALDMVLHAALGRDWMRVPTPKPVRSLLVLAEAPRAHAGRQEAMVDYHGMHGSEARLDHMVRVIPQAAPIYSATPNEQSTELERMRLTLQQAVDDGHPFDLLVLDTLSRVTEGAKENDSSDMAKVMSLLEILVKEFNLAVVVIHHSTKDGASAARGASAIRDNAQAVYAFSKAPSDPLVQVTTDKANYTDHMTPQQFRLLGHYSPWWGRDSVVVEYEGAAPGKGELSDPKRDQLELLEILLLGTNDFPSTDLDDLATKLEVSPKTVKRMLGDLGWASEGRGPKSRWVRPLTTEAESDTL